MAAVARNGGSDAETLTRRGAKRRPFIIGIAGGTSSGKSSVCSKIMERLGTESARGVVQLTQEAFYRQLSDAEREEAERGRYNFDHPCAFDDELLVSTLRDLRAGKSVSVPSYSMELHARTQETVVDCGDVVLAEGILLFYNPKIRELLDMRVFVDTDSDTRLARRVERDVGMGRDLSTILAQYKDLVKPAYEEFCLPTKKYAHITIPRGAENEPAINLMVQHIQEQLRSPRTSPSEELLPAPPLSPPLSPGRPTRPH